MDKPLWKKIDKNSNKPCPRWGHTCCVIGEEIVFFGGYADSNYMNDLWTYNSVSMKWEQIQTTGDKPAHRSNCSMNYDPENKQIVIFGGGGPNKQRFNSISILDWNSKNWIQIAPKENEPSPWQRTYHIAELKYPYLAIFGGEGVTDMDDLWIFSFATLGWTQVKMEKDAVRPCARRFHSSCLIGNQVFIVAGCYSKYRCLSDVYSLDLTPLLETGSTKELKWVERKLKSSSFLSRWGHSSVVYDNKIYVFAGRFSNDLNDLLVIDVQNNSLKNVKIGGGSAQHPKPRRRHCAGFVGSCMIAFGGFNGQYFNDLHYINVFELSNKTMQAHNHQQTFKSYLNKPKFADGDIYSKDGKCIKIHSSLIARYFKTYAQFTDYLDDINRSYESEALLNLLECLYKGFGKFQRDQIHEKYAINFPQSLNRRLHVNALISETEENEKNMLKLAYQSNERVTEILITLKHSQFDSFIENRRFQWFSDASIMFNGNEIRVNKMLLGMNSIYFSCLFSNHFSDRDPVEISLGKNYPTIIMDICLNYLMLGVVVTPSHFTWQSWIDLTQLAEYFCLSPLKSLCQSQLCNKISLENCTQLLAFSEKLQFNNLSMHCANFQLKSSLKLNELKRRISETTEPKTKLQKRTSFMRLYDTIKFDLYHSNCIEKQIGLKKKQSQTTIEEKENNRQYTNI